MMAVAILAGCKKNNEPENPGKSAGEGIHTSDFEAEYCHASITINLKGTYKYFVTVNVIADGKVMDVISYDKPTVVVEFPINGTSELKTEAVCDTESEDLVGTCNHKMDMAWDIQVKLGNDVIATKEYSDYVDYQSTVSDSQASRNAVNKLVHQDIDREFTITKTAITGPNK